MTILRNVDYLANLVPLQCVPAIEALRAFYAVVEACFSTALLPDFEARISHFREMYESTDLTVTTKVNENILQYNR